MGAMFCHKIIVEPEEKTDLELQRVNSEIRVWKSCCFGEINRDALMFFTQISILFCFMTFCCYQLVALDNCEAQQLYTSLITLCIGVLCPNPRMRK